MTQPDVWGSQIVVAAAGSFAAVLSKVRILKDGRILVVWQNTGAGGDGDGDGILARIYNADGTPSTAEFVVNTWRANDQTLPDATVLTDGRFVISWTSYTGTPGKTEIKARIFLPHGDAQGEEITVHDATQNTRSAPSIVALNNGGFVVSYAEGWNIKNVAFDSQGVSTTTTIPHAGAQLNYPVSTLLQNGNYVTVVAQRLFVSASEVRHAVKATLRAPDGTEIRALEEVASYSAEDHFNFTPLPSVVTLSNGRYVVVWRDNTVNGQQALKARFYDQNGNAASDIETLLFGSGKNIGEISVTALPNGGFAVSYIHDTNVLQRLQIVLFDQNGLPYDHLVVGQTAANSSITMMNDGRMIVGWGDFGSDTLKMQIYDPRTEGADWTGTNLGDQYFGTKFGDSLDGGAGGNDLLDGGEGNDRLIGGSGADILKGGNGTDWAVYNLSAQGVTIRLGEGSGRAVASGGDAAGDVITGIERLYGSMHNDVLVGNSLDNLLDGGDDGADILSGGGGNDTLAGGLGDHNDLLEGGAGADALHGGGGMDTAGYASSNAAVSINLATNASAGGHAEGDTLDSIENVKGSAYGDRLTGNAGNNMLDGGAGNDTLNGGLGIDVLKGGSGNDVYHVDHSRDRVSETASGGTADRVYASVSHSLAASVERLYATGTGALTLKGNSLANLISGNSAANRLSGGSGADSLRGNAGDDRLHGGLGKDVLAGGTGRDSFVFDTRASASNVDKISDFDPRYDLIRLDNAVFSQLGPAGTLKRDYLKLGAQATDSNDYLLYNKATGALSYDRDGAGGAAAVTVAILTNKKTLSYADFVVI